MAKHEDKRPTLQTLADITGLSLSTVSLSLRDGSALKRETREKVAKAAKQVGYVPNRAGVRLRTGRTNVLTLVLAADENVIDFTRILIQGIGSHIRGTKFHLNVIPEFQSADPLAAIRYIMDNRSADGIILTHTRAQDPRVGMMMDAQFPFISYGRTASETPHPFHDFNAERFIEMSVERLAQKGRKRIVLAAVDNGTMNYAIMVEHFMKAVEKTGVTGELGAHSDRLATTGNAREYGRQLGMGLQEFDAIICNNELTALAVIGGLQDVDKQFGRDYDLIGKQTTDILPTLYPKMDTVAEDFFSAGEVLAKLLIDRIHVATNADQLQTLQEPIAHWRDTV